ncbi:hypothetical protein CHLRE_16g657964v5 [Chlamydomonas reinhardtii]|uniref:Uncharacterized protein n=1 Tax=Chlamydomonas reinhardtii TaxID=3055 RepID=A0A2K3CTB4_CHLRE|nr:uncharacterized protein CHLRE_16g657964v5 [Chlamydomonas reinhardtii]PNW71525.1 hypothetical protein CHLRE_16g657964v5 [Chlamydomonas reinhardtii]
MPAAVNIFAVLKKKDGNHQVLVVKQYRPPMGKHTIELPAGLVDKDESPQVRRKGAVDGTCELFVPHVC